MNERPPRENAIRADYASIRAGLADHKRLVVLTIGDSETLVASGTGFEADAVVALAIGAERTSDAYFRHSPPTPLELENAITQVEDEIARLRTMATDDALLVTRDESLRAIALIAGMVDQETLQMPLELVEKTFDRLTAISQGRPAAYEGLPDSATFAATLLILREFMHHMKFASLAISR